MALQYVPGVDAAHAALSEFLGFNGDCTQTASLVCRHVLDPHRWPLDAAALNALVKRDQSQGIAGASGAQTLSNAAQSLKEDGIAFEQYGYQELLSNWHELLMAHAGRDPILLQVAHGSAFGVEGGLHYHSIAILGHDAGANLYAVADGDNPACNGGNLVHYSISQIANSVPCGVLVVHVPSKLADGPDQPGAEWLPTTHLWGGRGGHKAQWVVVHGTGYSLSQTAGDVMRDFQATNANSTHFAVGTAGDIAQGVHERDTAWGNGIVEPGHDPWWNPNINPNFQTISIEHVQNHDNSATLTPKQQASSFTLIHDICVRNGIPLRPGDAEGGIVGHHSISPVSRKYCPGNYPWDALWTFLGAKQVAGVPTGWKDDGATLTAPNGVVVKLGFRQYVLAHSWDAANVPMEAEQYPEQVDPADSHSGKGTRQEFADTILAWTPAKGIYALHAGEAAHALEAEAEAKAKEEADQLAKDDAQVKAQAEQIAKDQSGEAALKAAVAKDEAQLAADQAEEAKEMAPASDYVSGSDDRATLNKPTTK